MAMRIEALTRYPVKGLSGEILDSVELKPGQGFPCDRQYGFARPDSGFDPANPKPLPKTKFYMLARDATLALLKAEFNDKTSELTLTSSTASGQFNISTDAGKREASNFLQSYLSLPASELPQLYDASPHRFTDVSVDSTEMMNAVSIINTDSVDAFARDIGQEVDPNRFRGNIHLSGLTPFTELDRVGEHIIIGAARLKIVRRTKRCPATEVDLNTAERNIKTPKMLLKHYNHMDMGVYAQVIEGGTISAGDIVEFL